MTVPNYLKTGESQSPFFRDFIGERQSGVPLIHVTPHIDQNLISITKPILYESYLGAGELVD
jgi:hypothetical protein